MKNKRTEIRITTGTAKNKRLKAPKTEGFRAVQEVAKMAVFAILEDRIINAKCLDLFAGSGNMGLEALSRGAQWCDFVDEDYYAIGALRENVKITGFEDRSDVIKSDAVKYAANTEHTYDIIFVDPFYENTSHIFLTKNLEEILNENGVIIFFHGENLDINNLIKDTGLKIEDTRRFGKSYFDILKHLA